MASEIRTDVLVVGGGAAGVAAAVGASQRGARVLLVEQYGFLGGAVTASSVLTYCGFFSRRREQVVRGVGQLFLDRLDRVGLLRTHTFAHTGNTVVLLDRETTKLAMDELVTSHGIRTLLHSRIVRADATDGAVGAVEVVHRGGTLRVYADQVVDCSGDGAVAHLAGADCLIAAPQARQACTQVMLVGGLPDDADLSPESMDRAIALHNERHQTELVRSNGIAARLPVSGEVMMLLADQHADVLDPEALTAAEQAGRALCWEFWRAFSSHLDGWERSWLAATGPQIGIRESRRMAGIATVVADDVAQARKRPDGIARCGWPMEDHSIPGRTSYHEVADGGWYHIPLDALRSRNRRNLWAAGRLTSSDHRAYASLRVMGTAFATGHAAGVAAAVAADTGEVPEVGAVRAELARQGALT